jgi:hypothetical protein
VLRRSSWFRRLEHAVPLAPLLLAGQVVFIASQHLARLDRAQRRRLVALLRQSRGRPSWLSDAEREELYALLASLEPRLFFGSTLRRLSPMPIPKRLLYGPRGSTARKALSEGD